MRQRVFFFSKRALPVFIRPWGSQSSGVDQGCTTFFLSSHHCFRVWPFRDWRLEEVEEEEEEEEEEDGDCGGMDPTGRDICRRRRLYYY